MKGGLCKIFQVSKYQVNTGYLHEVLGLVGHGFWVNVKLAILHRCSRPVSVGHMTKLWQRETKNNIMIWFNEGQTPNGFLEKASITNFHYVLIIMTIANNAPRICFLQTQECQNSSVLEEASITNFYQDLLIKKVHVVTNVPWSCILYMQDNSFNMICFRSGPLCRCLWEPMQSQALNSTQYIRQSRE